MNYVLIAFLVGVLIFGVGFIYLLRGAWQEIAQQARDHARYYAISYVKGGALIAIATGACFTETFFGLSKEEAAQMQWWGWAILAWKPIAAGLATLCAFLDRSATAAAAQKTADAESNSRPPIPLTPK